jgi:RNA polymerase sigma factor (sigma-70 family)
MLTNDECPPLFDSDPNSRFAALRRPLLFAAIAKSSDRNFAEDAVQITMERVFKSFPQLGHISDQRLIAYSREVLKNVLIDEYRKNRKRTVIPVAPEDLPDEFSFLGLPESYVFVQELRAAIYEFISELPERQREVVNLCLVKEMPPKQVAKELGLAEDTVRRYLRTALRRLEKTMVESSEEVSA